MTPLSIWEKNLIQVENGKFFINSRIFDEISGKEIPNKFRRFETLVAEMFNGQNINPNEFIRKIPVKGHKSGTYIPCRKCCDVGCTPWI